MISKGGVGKTTTAVNLAAGLALAGKKVLLVDTDTQGQVTYLLGLKNEVGLADVIYGDKEPEDAVVQARENLFVLSGGKSLAGVKRVIDRKDFGGENTFTEILSPIEKDYDFIIVDSSPGWDTLTVNVLFYVHEVLAPVSLEVMTLQGLKEFLKSLSAVAKYNKNVCLKYIVPTFLDNRIRQPKEILDGIRELYGEKCCPPIRYNVRLSQAPAAGKTIFEFSPESHGAEDYRELVRMVTGEANLFT
jgi:chromosome partitioning protein